MTTNIPSFNRVYVLSDVGTKSEYLQVVDSFGMSAAFKLCSSNVTVNNFCIGPDGSNIPNGIKKSYWSNSSSPNCDQIREDLTCNNGTLTDQFGKTGSFSTFTSTSCSYSSLPVKVSLFKISPNTINSGGACKPTWTLSLTDNHSVCELYRQPVANFIYKNSYTGTYPITESFLDNGITNETTYKLFCYELQNDGSKTNSTTSYSTCYINPTTKERS